MHGTIGCDSHVVTHSHEHTSIYRLSRKRYEFYSSHTFWIRCFYFCVRHRSWVFLQFRTRLCLEQFNTRVVDMIYLLPNPVMIAVLPASVFHWISSPCFIIFQHCNWSPILLSYPALWSQWLPSAHFWAQMKQESLALPDIFLYYLYLERRLMTFS